MGRNQELGDEGEEVAAQFLEDKGLRCIERHFYTRWGEIDLICRDRDTVVFVEVKHRQRKSRPSALDAIHPAKQKRLIQAALMYMKRSSMPHENMRFDVVTIEEGQIEWLPNAFEASSQYTW